MMAKLKIAIQKSGRLHDDSIKLLRQCGIKLNNAKGQLKCDVTNFPMEVLYLRNSDIPQYLEDGVADIAFIGENVLVEKNKNLDVVEPLGFAQCRVSLAVPRACDVNSIEYYNGKKIATSYPNTLSSFLKENNLTAEIHEISGSVEIAPNIGLADAICDIVSSGSTLFKNGLIEDQILFASQAVLASSKKLTKSKKAILDKLIFRIKAVNNAKNKKYILLNVPNEKIDKISSILPVLKSPTVLPLNIKGWSSLHSVIDESQFWEVIDELKANGAEDILIVPIDKMVI